MRYIRLLLAMVFVTVVGQATELQRTGWNLIAACENMIADEIDLTDIEEIQSQSGESIYTGNYAEYSNLEMLKAGYGYWVKGSIGSQFESGESLTRLIKPLTRTGWNLMGACETVAKEDVNLSDVQEIQSQTGETIYTGTNAQYSNLYNLREGYGYWVRGDGGSYFTAKNGVGIPDGFMYQAINNSGQVVETTYGEYTVKIFSNVAVSPNDMANHTGIVVQFDDNSSLATMNIQEDYRGERIVIALYDNMGHLISVSHTTVVDLLTPITTVTLSVNNIETPTPTTEEEEEKDLSATYQGIKVFANPLTVDEYGLESVTDADFNALSIEDQRVVANKIFSLLYYGMSKMDLDKLIASGKFISTVQAKLKTSNSDLVAVEDKISSYDYHWDRYKKNREVILARLYNLELGQEYLNRWAAYVLTQSIMFSPAYELDTVQPTDIANVYNSLVLYMDDEYSMQLITFLHMISNDNWKRFRSPEDNGREMLEIFLFDFNDSHVPMAGIALKNWKLDRYDLELEIGLNQNTVPQPLFGTTVTTGTDFYRELVKCDEFLPGVIKRLVGMYFGDYSQSKQAQIISMIEQSKPERFQDILLQIIFSKEFLYNSERVKGFEEAAFHIAKRLDFFDGKNFFYHIDSSIDGMNQGTMKYKLGRDTMVPTDTLSFAYFYSVMRDYIVRDTKKDAFNDWDRGWSYAFIDRANPNSETLDGFIDYVFLATIDRLPNSEEKDAIKNYCLYDSRGYDDMTTYNDRRAAAIVILDYISRLTEVYTFKAIEE